jgi:hypothetical protein
MSAPAFSPAPCLTLPPARRISDALLIIVSILIGLSLVGQVAKHVYGHTMLKGFVPTFYVDYESSAPTWYSSAALGLAAALLAFIAAAKFQLHARYRWHWAALSVLFFLLSLDEIAMIHELPIEPLRERWNAGGVLYYAWVVPGAACVAVVGLAFLPFFLGLPGRTQAGFLLAACMFVGGAIGVEMLSGVQADALGEENLDYALIVTLEEFLEMLGIVALIRTLLEYAESSLGGLQLRLPAA